MCLAITGVITEIRDEEGVPMALVDTGPALRTACLLTCPDAAPGATVLLYSGYVLEVLEPPDGRVELIARDGHVA